MRRAKSSGYTFQDVQEIRQSLAVITTDSRSGFNGN